MSGLSGGLTSPCRLPERSSALASLPHCASRAFRSRPRKVLNPVPDGWSCRRWSPPPCRRESATSPHAHDGGARAALVLALVRIHGDRGISPCACHPP